MGICGQSPPFFVHAFIKALCVLSYAHYHMVPASLEGNLQWKHTAMKDALSVHLGVAGCMYPKCKLFAA
jgi:hypothetical protein